MATAAVTWWDFALIAGIVGVLAALWRFVVTDGRGTLDLYYDLGGLRFAWRVFTSLAFVFCLGAVTLGTLLWAIWLVLGP